MSVDSDEPVAKSATPVIIYRRWVYAGIAIGGFVPFGLGLWFQAEYCPDSTCGAAGLIWILFSVPLFLVGLCMCLYGLTRIGDNKSRPAKSKL
jgi:hypothetical protein